MEDTNLYKSSLAREYLRRHGTSSLLHQWLQCNSSSHSVYAQLHHLIHNVNTTSHTSVQCGALMTLRRIELLHSTNAKLSTLKGRHRDHSGLILPYSMYKYLRQRISFIRLPSVYAESKTSDSESKIPEGENVTIGGSVDTGQKQGGEECRKEFRLNEEVRNEEVEEYLRTETAMDRLKRMYYKDPITHRRGMDLQRLSSPIFQVFVLGFIFSALLRWPVSRNEFKKKNQLVKYHVFDTHRVLRARYDHIIMDTLETGFYYGGVLAAFVGSMLLTAKSIAVYRNKDSVLDYTAGAAVTGALFRIFIGPKAMLAGGILAGVGGTCLGTVLYILQQKGGLTQDKIHFEDVRTLMENGSILRPHLQKMKDEKFNTD